MDRHTTHRETSPAPVETRRNDSEADRELMVSIQRQLVTRFLTTNALEHVHDQSLIQFVSDTIDPRMFQNDAEYRVWLHSQGIDADNLHAISVAGQEVLRTMINRWVMEQQTNHESLN